MQVQGRLFEVQAAYFHGTSNESRPDGQRATEPRARPQQSGRQVLSDDDQALLVDLWMKTGPNQATAGDESEG